MSPHAFTEDQLVEQPAVALFSELGWSTVSASDGVFGAEGTLQRETKGDVVLISRLRAALERLNPTLAPEAIPSGTKASTRGSDPGPARGNEETGGCQPRRAAIFAAPWRFTQTHAYDKASIDRASSARFLDASPISQERHSFGSAREP